MANTRFMERMFSATEKKEEEILNQVAKDIQDAKENGSVDTDELKFEKVGDNQISISDKANNETTIAEISEDGNIDLYNPEDQLVEEEDKLEGFLHPEVGEEVVPGDQTNPVESVEEHLEEGVISPNLPDGGKNPEAGCEKSVEEIAAEGPEICPECGKESCECEAPEKKKDEQKEFSVYSDNTVIQKIFSQQEYCEMLFSEVIASEDTEDVAKVGSLKIEKVDENSVIVSDLKSGDQAKVTLDEEEMEVEELGTKTFSEEEEYVEHEENYDPLHVVGVDAGNHQLVDSSVYTEEAANDLATRLTDAGVDAVQVFEDESDARDYAIELLENLGVENPESIEKPEEATFSDVDGSEFSVYVTRYFSKNTVFMDRLFSEVSNGIEISQAKIEDALENGDEIETETEIVTPISATEAVIQDKENDGEYTKVTIKDETMECDPISEDEANDLIGDIAVSEEEVDEDEQAEDFVTDAEDVAEQAEEDIEENQAEEEEHDFSDVRSNEAETKFFSEKEQMTQYMIRLFSDQEDEKLIEEAIEKGDEIENDTVIITPVSEEIAIVADKENGEFTKATLSEDDIEVIPVSEEEATAMMEKKEVSDDDKKEEEKEEKKEDEKEEKEFSESVLDKWFATVVAPAAGIQAQPAAAQVAPVPVAVETVEEVPAEVAPEEIPSVEAIEDKAIAAVQQIQAAAAEAEAAILNAKAAPVDNEETDLQEATFSNNEEESKEKTFSNNSVLLSWIKGTKRN